jgi:hypothetical protein
MNYPKTTHLFFSFAHITPLISLRLSLTLPVADLSSIIVTKIVVLGPFFIHYNISISKHPTKIDSDTMPILASYYNGDLSNFQGLSGPRRRLLANAAI